MARRILIIHAVAFALLLLASPTSIAVSIYYPDLLPPTYLLGWWGTHLAIVLWSWRYWGSCPLTVWEKRHLRRETGWEYYGSWMKHYARQWFGIRIPNRFDVVFSVSLFAAPIAVGTYKLV